MPSTQYRVTFGWEQAAIGRTETYISKPFGVGEGTAEIQSLIDARNNMLFNTTRWRGVRISTYGQRRASAFYPPGTYAPIAPGNFIRVPPTGTRAVNLTTNVAADQARAVLQLRVTYDGNRRAVRYLSFPPDSVLRNELDGPDVNGNPAWVNAYDSWVVVLIRDGWGLRGRIIPGGGGAPPAVLSPIRNWVSTAGPPQSMGFVLANTPAPGIAVASSTNSGFVLVSGVRRRGTDRTSYNGRYVVQSVVPNSDGLTTTYFLRGTEAGEPDSIKLTGQVYPINYTVFGISKVEIIRSGVHKAGKPLAVPVGRRVKRASLDP